jgi:WD40 repeat protein
MLERRIHALITDAERLLLAYRIPVIEGALHVYYSALATMPSCALLEETAPHDGHGIPLLITKRAAGWGFREMILDNSDIIACFAYSCNGKLLASVSAFDAVLRVWDVATGTALHAMSVPDTEATDQRFRFSSIAFSPNSQQIVSGHADCTVRLWDVVTGSQHTVMRGHTGLVRCVAFSPDGTIIISGSDDGTLRIWDAGTGAEQQVMTGHTDEVHSLAFAPNGQTIVSASDDGTLRIWDVLTGIELRAMECDNNSLYCVAFSPDGATIASGSSDGTLQLWSATNGTREHALEGHEDGVRSLAFSPDSRSIVSCDYGGLARFWDVTTGIEIRRLTGENIAIVAYSPDGKSVAVGLRHGAMRLRDAETSFVARSIPEGHQSYITCVAFSPNGLLIACGSGGGRGSDHTMQIWDAITGTQRHVMEVGDNVTSVAFSPDNRAVACGLGHHRGTVQVWDAVSGQKQCSATDQHGRWIHSLAFSSDGKSLVSYSTMAGTVRTWDAATGAQQRILTYPLDSDFLRGSAAFTTDGKAVIMREDSGKHVVVGFWDLTTSQSEYRDFTSPHERTPSINDDDTSKQHHFEREDLAWICPRNGQEESKHVCWLPQERRGRLAHNGMKVCIGGDTGTITILDFSHVDTLQHVV